MKKIISILVPTFGLLLGISLTPKETIKPAPKRAAVVIATSTTASTSTTTSTTTTVATTTTTRPKPPVTQPRPPSYPAGSVQQMIVDKFGPYAKKALAVAWCESNYYSNILNATPPDLSYGLFQINMYGKLGPKRREAYHLPNNEALFDPMTNINIAFSMSSGGRNFSAWSCN